METSLPPPPPGSAPLAEPESTGGRVTVGDTGTAPARRRAIGAPRWLAGGEPQPGRLTPGWRLTVLATWVLAFLGWTAAWKASRELGLSTWWLGPSAAPRPVPILLLPFAPVAAIVVLTMRNARRLPWYGLVASAIGAAIGAGDLARVERLGLVEVAVAAATAIVSIASFAGRYRTTPP